MIEALATDYLDLKETIAVLEEQAKAIREHIQVLMDTDTDPPPTWTYSEVEVVRVKGRVMKKLDRKELVKLGVSGAVLDAATKTTTGQPTIRIQRPKPVAVPA
jgi:hypothetical protein